MSSHPNVPHPCDLHGQAGLKTTVINVPALTTQALLMDMQVASDVLLLEGRQHSIHMTVISHMGKYD